jgi:aldehyde dehydrogenase (NAD+)/aldehyde dehydrogenase
MRKILNYINIGKEEGAIVLAGGEAGNYEGDRWMGYYVQPTVLKGTNNMRVFQEEILGRL